MPRYVLPIDGDNVKLLNIAKAASLAVLVAGATACSKGGSTEQHLARANQFIASEEYKSAVIELKNALQQDNQSAEARYLLGKVYLESGDVLSAEKELQRALDLGWPGFLLFLPQHFLTFTLNPLEI